MDALKAYSIPIKGLQDGIHQFVFHIDKSFFEHFENAPIEESNIDMKLSFDKRTDMFVLQFDFQGTVNTNCDRCLVKIDLPIADNQQLLVKFSESEEQEEADVIFISREDHELNVAKYIYEYICLAMPLIKAYDCEQEENRPCDMEMLKFLQNGTDAKSDFNPIWDELRNFNKK